MSCKIKIKTVVYDMSYICLFNSSVVLALGISPVKFPCGVNKERLPELAIPLSEALKVGVL